MKRILAVLAVLAVLGGAWALRDRLPGAQPPTQSASPVLARPAKSAAVQPVAAGTVVDRIEGIGTVRARDAVTVTVEAAGIVREILFDHGAAVAKGTVLVRLDADQEKAQVAAAESALETARRAYERAVQLRRGGTASQQVLDDAAAAHESARAALAVAQARLAERTVRAPFAGRLGFRQVSPGAYIRPGEPITTLDDIATVQVDFMVPERQLAALAPGQSVGLHSVAHPEIAFAGAVLSIGSRVDPASRQVQVRAEVPNPQELLRPGQLVAVDIALRQRTAIVVPETAVVTVGHQTFAFVVDEAGRVMRRELAIAGRRENGLEVSAGLAAGERLVVEGATKLSAGDRIREVPPVAVASESGS